MSNLVAQILGTLVGLILYWLYFIYFISKKFKEHDDKKSKMLDDFLKNMK